MVYNLYSDSIVGSNKVFSSLKRPDLRAREANKIGSERVDINTWIRTENNHESEQVYSCLLNKWSQNKRRRRKYMGSTLNDIFANSVSEYKNKPCLGYRAVVTCPVLALNEEGKHVLQEKSFRSSFTWYTYEQVGRRVQDIASGLYFNSIFPNSRALFYASTSLEWFLASQACFQLAGQLVVAPEISEPISLLRILKEAEVSVLFTSCDRLKNLNDLFKLIQQDSLLMFQIKKIVLIDWLFSIDFSEPLFASLIINDESSSKDLMSKLISLGQIEEAGVENPINLSCTKFVEDIDNNQQEIMDMLEFNPKKKLNFFDINCNKRIEKTSKYFSKVRKISFFKNISPIDLPQDSLIVPLTVPIQRKFLNKAQNKLKNSKDFPEHFNIDKTINKLKKTTQDKDRKPSIALTNVDNNMTNILYINDIENLPQSKTKISHQECQHYFNSNDYIRDRNIEKNSKNSSSNKSSSSDLTRTIKRLDDEPIKPDDLAMIVYSHGQLGDLRAVMLSHSNLARNNLYLNGMIDENAKHCTTLPSDMVIEFITEICIFSEGGSIGYSSNNKTLFYDGSDLFNKDLSDLEASSPTLLLVRPYILESLRSSIQNYLSLQYNPLKGFILTNLIYDYKKYWARKHFDTPIVDRVFCFELKKLFGSNLKFILCNGTTDCSETKDFFTFMVNIPVIELYGLDEAIVSLISVDDIWHHYDTAGRKGGRKLRRSKRSKLVDDGEFSPLQSVVNNVDVHSNTNHLYENEEDEDQEDFQNMQLMPRTVDRNISIMNNSKNLLLTSSILSPTFGIRIRLEDWEDFRTSDLPFPRGRMIIGGEAVSKGYYNRELETKLSFYTDSNYINWFRTDDIARVFPNGSFEIISGLSDIIKMVDGQFISLSQIEHILKNSQFVDNVCVICGDDKKFVIALVVPNLRCLALKSPGQSNLKMAIGMEPEPEELVDIEFRREVCNDRLLCEFVTEHLNELIINAGFQALLSKFHLVPEIWTPETELVTPSFKPKRSAIQNFYASDIQSIVRLEFKRSCKKRLSSRLNNNLKRVSSSGSKLDSFLSSNGGRLSY